MEQLKNHYCTACKRTEPHKWTCEGDDETDACWECVICKNKKFPKAKEEKEEQE